jgi:hypothetical protein
MQVQFINRVSSPAFVPSSKLTSPLTSDYPQSSLFAIYFEYLQSIYLKNISLGFNFNSSKDLSLSLIPYNSVLLNVNPDNNHYALLYSSNIYNRQKSLSNLYSFLSISCVAIFLLTLIFGSKRISAEMLMVFQIAYASLLTAPKISPLLSAITSLSPVNNGYNLMYSSALRPF